MAIAIREYLGYEGFKVDWNYQETSVLNVTESQEDPISPSSLMVDIEGIHVGPTRNHTWYTKEALEGSVHTWTKPYLRPLIMHHNEKDGKIIGRVRFATYTELNTRSGTGAMIFTANVPDTEGKEQLLDGRLKTVSIGAIVYDCRCSICNHNIAKYGECDEHKRGVEYDGKKCYWIIISMEAKELSYVIVPSDPYSHNLRIYKPTGADMNVAANYDSKGVLNVAESNTDATILNAGGENIITATPEGSKILTDEITELKAKNAELITKLEDKDKETEQLLKDVQTAKDELENAKVLLNQVQKTLDETKSVLTVKESELSAEITLRESLETRIIEISTDTKNNLVENITLLRGKLGKSVIVKEELEARTEDSLKDAVRDLKEELNSSLDVTKITPVVNPSFTESKDDKSNVEKDKKHGNIDLTEGLQDVFSAIVGSKSKTY